MIYSSKDKAINDVTTSDESIFGIGISATKRYPRSKTVVYCCVMVACLGAVNLSKNNNK